jgi:hypothetical protein
VRDRLRQRAGSKRGPLTGPNPTDRGKSGSKIYLITDRNGLPLSLGISGANMHDRPEAARARHPAHPLPARPAPPATGQAPRRQGLRLRPPAPMAPPTPHTPPHRPQRHRVLPTARPIPLGRRKESVLARRMPAPAPPLRTQGRTLPRLRRHRRSPHQLPPTHQLKRRQAPPFPDPRTRAVGSPTGPLSLPEIASETREAYRLNDVWIPHVDQPKLWRKGRGK